MADEHSIEHTDLVGNAIVVGILIAAVLIVLGIPAAIGWNIWTDHQREKRVEAACNDAEQGEAIGYYEAWDRVGGDIDEAQDDLEAACPGAYAAAATRAQDDWDRRQKAADEERYRENPQDRPENQALRAALSEYQPYIAAAEVQASTVDVQLNVQSLDVANRVCDSLWWFRRNWNGERDRTEVEVHALVVRGRDGDRLQWAGWPVVLEPYANTWASYCEPEDP